MLMKSALWTHASGKLGGVVMSHNKSGVYCRAYRVPVNPASSFQTAVRDNLSQLMVRFQNTLTSVQRAAWDVFAQNVTTTNRVGDVISLSAQNWYVSFNSLRLQAGVAVVDPAPVVWALAALTLPVATIAAAGTTVSLAYTNTDAWANEVGGYLLLYASRPQNSTKNFFAGPYRFAGKVAGAGSPPSSPAVITLPFVIGPAGSKMYFKAVAVRADGRSSPTFRFVGVA